MTRSKTLSVMAVLSVIAIVTIIIVSKKDINLDEVTMECPSSIMRGAPTITDYGNDFVVLQTLKPKRLRVGQSYKFGHIIFGPPYKIKTALASDDNQRNYLVTIEEMYAAPYENTYLRWIEYDCKHPVDNSQKSLLSDISSLFAKFDSAEWVISDAIEMVSNFDAFQSNSIYHYVVYIKGESKNVPINSASFDATVEFLSFATVEDAQRYYRIQNDILQRYAYYGSIESAINITASEHEAYCNHNSFFFDEIGCIFIGRSNDTIVEMYLFPRSERADLEQVNVYWHEFVKNLWPSVLDSYEGASATR